MIILPGDEAYYQTLATIPPDFQKGQTLICREGSELLEAVQDKTLREYLYGGEYEERLAQIEFQEWLDSIE